MTQDYKVESCSLEELLGTHAQPFRVPEFQRSYSWTASEIGALFDDLLDAPKSAPTHAQSYFLGAVVLVPQRGHMLVIDGQQRIATLSMIIGALRERMALAGMQEDAEALGRLLFSKQLGQSKRVRMTLQEDDAKSYEIAIGSPGSIEHTKGRPLSKVLRAVLAIREEIQNRVGDANEREMGPRLLELAKRFMEGVKIVRIEAPDESAAYRLFEALNDRGRDLTAADLIKNKIFSRARTNIEAVRTEWKQLQRTVDDELLLHFLRHFWIAFRKHVRRSDLFDAYDHEVSNAAPEEIANLIGDLARSGETYRDIALPKKISKGSTLEPIADHLTRLDKLRARSARPLLLLFAKRWPSVLRHVASMCETASIRHALACARNPNQLEKTYGNICDTLRLERDPKVALQTVVRELGTCVPEDDVFRDALVDARIKSPSPGWRLLLVRIEESSGDGELRVSGADQVHIEHVLPQSPSNACLKESRLTKDRARDLACRLGNLTLLSGKRNIALSNGAFSAKRRMLAKSAIGMTKSLAARTRWTEAEIDARSRELADAACLVWEWPPSSIDAEVRQPANRGSRSTKREPNQLALPQLRDPVPQLHKLDPDLAYENSKWVPRILWALDAASRRGLGAIHAAEIARLLSEELGQTIQSTNTARAFRDLRKEKSVALAWWSEREGTYVITDAGRDANARFQARRVPKQSSKNAPAPLAKTQPRVALEQKPKKRDVSGRR